MTINEKMAITESKINDTRKDIRGIYRRLERLTYHKELKDLVTTEELKEIENLENLLTEIEYRINDILSK